MQTCESSSSISRLRRSGAVLTVLLLLSSADGSLSSPGPSPLRLAVYYGYPSLVNGAQGDLARAVAVFSEYDVIVLGDGLQLGASTSPRGAGPEEHAFTKALIRQLRVAPRHPEVYGYVDLGRTQRLPLSELVGRINLWADMEVAGVFLDEAGYDFGVTRERQNAALKAAHARGLTVCFNAFRPSDVFGAAPVPLNEVGGGNPNATAPLVTPRDAVLLESFAIRNGVPEPADGLEARARVALNGRARFGTRVFAITTSGEHGDDAAPTSYAWWMASALGIDAYGWGTPAFSAGTSTLPWVPRPAVEGVLARSEYAGDLIVEEGRWRRSTTAGTIVVDTVLRQGRLLPR